MTSAEKGSDTDMIFLYSQHVFDTIKHGILLVKIKCIGFTETLIELFELCLEAVVCRCSSK